MPIAFDPTGFQQHDQTTWFNPGNGDQVTLNYFDLVPDLPASLDDMPKLRHDLAVTTGEIGCLIEAHLVRLGDVPALFQVVKVPLPNQPTGQAFLGSFTVPRAQSSAVLKLQAVEQGTTGVREATLLAQVGFDNWVMPHPYAPEVEGRLPFHAGDDPRYDQQFGNHPLSRVRAWAHHIIRTARVDPRFAALPPFQPAGQAPDPAQGPAPAPDSAAPAAHSAPTQAPVTAPVPVQAPDSDSAPGAHSAPEPSAPEPSAPPVPPGPAVGSTLTTVVPGVPVGGYLPLWINDECTFWRMTDPDAVLEKLALGALARSPLTDQRFRDLVALDESSSTIMLLNRYRSEDGGIASGMTTLTRVTGREAHEALTTDTLLEAFRWIGRVSVAAAQRGECVTVEPGTHVADLTEPYVMLAVQEHEGRQVSIAQTEPTPPAGTPMWNGMASLNGPATRETIEAGGLLSMYAMNAWGEHPLRLCLTFGPIPPVTRV
ncbi:hypothetical protein ALI22I_26955 [Saccharothrix sp. ALI-22-I]|uniref:hypothetical protein n=1 Tax=Saccharothrix sp. ALI-22-I TaxID=1933778 RepID=UPI00097CA1FF|nr:hypothetical protein [Saccharothrix sp. ALI-22-I]ONI85450.1 hypothetical protein ALI22I_26955 [Saccharothrix sp. ALI-22-I]